MNTVTDPRSAGPSSFGPAGFFVRNYQFTMVLFAMLVALGLASWRAIPRQEDPTFPVPIYTIVAVYPGASPQDMEQLVVDPIEESMGELDEVEEIRSRMEDGLATVLIEFGVNSDAERKYDEVVRELNALRPELPSGLYSLEVERGGSAEVNIVQLALASDVVPHRMLEDEAKRLKKRLETVPGVRTAETHAIAEREVSVALDLGRLTRLEIPPAHVLSAIDASNANLPGGSIEAGGRAFNIKTSGTYASLEEIRRTPLRAVDGALVSVGDVADVQWGTDDDRHVARFNGERAVWVTATQREGHNIGQVRDRIWQELDRFEEALPAEIALERGFDQSVNVASRLSQLQRDFLIAIGLVLITLLPLGLRASGIVMVSIPLSIAIGVALLNVTGYSLNQLSIVGFVIALGLLVDDSIVVTENIARALREGYGRAEAAILGTKQIAVAAIGSTVMLILSFVPLIFLPGLPGRFIRVLPLTVVLTVFASLCVALTIIPWLASRLLEDGTAARPNPAMRLLERGIGATYAPLLQRALRRPVLTLSAAAALVLGSLALVPVVGFSLFPAAGTPQFLINVETPIGSSLAETDQAVRFAEQVLAEHPEVATVFGNVGRDNPFVYYNETPRGENLAVGQLFVLLHRSETDGMPALLDELRVQLAAYPGARIEVKELMQGPPVDAPIALRVSGENLDTLRVLAGQVEEVLAGTDGTQYVNNPLRLDRTDLKIDVDRAKAGLFAVAPLDVDRTVRLGIAGLPAGRFRDDEGEEFDIRVRLAHDARPTVEALDRVYITSLRSEQVPLRQVADVRFTSSAPLIEHFNRERAVTLTSFVRTGFNTDRVTRAALATLEDLSLPAGYELIPAGEIESRERSFGGVGNAIIVAVFMILAILVLEFRTFRGTLIVASVIPLGLVGGIAALFISGHTLSFSATIGFVALIGIVVKTSILLVDLANRLRAEGVPLDDAIRRAGEVRFVPIVLTTLTAVGGLLPLALAASSLYSPLAWVIIGGLVSSTLLAWLVTPVMYKILAPPVSTEG